jgi:protein-tyrosine phosphatase
MPRWGVVRILFVCTGNICRSPTAEGVMRALVADAGLTDRVEIDSAGTGSWHVGESPDPRTCAAAKRRGLDLAHRARQVEPRDLDRFDYLIALDGEHLRDLQQLARTRPKRRAQIRLLRSFEAEAPPDADVPDPYYGDEAGFDEVYAICERACRGLLEHVRRELAPR